VNYCFFQIILTLIILPLNYFFQIILTLIILPLNYFFQIILTLIILPLNYFFQIILTLIILPLNYFFKLCHPELSRQFILNFFAHDVSFLSSSFLNMLFNSAMDLIKILTDIKVKESRENKTTSPQKMIHALMMQPPQYFWVIVCFAKTTR